MFTLIDNDANDFATLNEVAELNKKDLAIISKVFFYLVSQANLHPSTTVSAGGLPVQLEVFTQNRIYFVFSGIV